MNPHGQNAVVEGHDLRENGIWECAYVESTTAWGSMHKNTLHRHQGHLELCYLSLGRRVYVDEDRTCVMHGGNIWRNAPDVLHSSMGRPSGSARFYCIELLPPRRGKMWCGLDYAAAKQAWATLMTLDPATQPIADEGLQPCFDRLFALLHARAGAEGEEKVKEKVKVGGQGQQRNVNSSSVQPPTFHLQPDLQPSTFHLQPDLQPPTSNLNSIAGMALRMAFNALVADFVACVIMPPKPAEGTEKVRALIARINASDPREALSVQELVKEVGVSSSYFVSAFQRVVGQTPGQYILSRRLESASRHIAAGESIRLVSEGYNFDSTQHFTRAFNKYFLETPKRYFLRVQAERKAGERTDEP